MSKEQEKSPLGSINKIREKLEEISTEIKEVYDRKAKAFLDETLYNYELGLPENAYISTDKIQKEIDEFSNIIYQSDKEITKLDALHKATLEALWYVLKD